MPYDLCKDALEKAQEARMLAALARTENDAHKDECARRYEDWRYANEQLRTQISESNRDMRKFVTESIDETNSSVKRLFSMLLTSSATVILLLLSATGILTFYLITMHK